jgi:hypothetical protein
MFNVFTSFIAIWAAPLSFQYAGLQEYLCTAAAHSAPATQNFLP